MILCQPPPFWLKCRYAIHFNAFNETQYQIPWPPNVQFLCHILATFRKSGKEFLHLYIQTELRSSFHHGKFVSLGKCLPGHYCTFLQPLWGVDWVSLKENPLTGFLTSSLPELAGSEWKRADEEGDGTLLWDSASLALGSTDLTEVWSLVGSWVLGLGTISKRRW